MKKSILFLFLACVYIFSISCPSALAYASFEDTRFQGKYTTENIQAILDEYKLYDGWYWVTQANVTQDFHGRKDTPGWTETTEAAMGRAFKPVSGWYGCRWNLDSVSAAMPNTDGWGECFGFAQFIGYLLSGDYNPHGHWAMFSSIKESKGLKPGDIVRISYEGVDGLRQHSAVVYEVLDDQVIFIQVCGANYNKLLIRYGYYGAGLDTNNLAAIAKAPGLRIYRAPDNLNGVYPPDYKAK